jgi:hypothetical protein
VAMPVADPSFMVSLIGRDACSALANLLRNPRSKFRSLSIHHTQIDDEGVDILLTGLIGNNGSKFLTLLAIALLRLGGKPSLLC